MTPREKDLFRSLGPWGVGLGMVILAVTASAETLRVGSSGDYAPFSLLELEHPQDFRGLSPDLARAYAKDRGLELEFVKFRWPDLLADLQAGHFDVAMSGITMRSERSVAGRFTVPITTSGAVLLVPDASPLATAQDLDRAELDIAVNAGGHLERVARHNFTRARIRALADNQSVIAKLASGEVDAAVTDTREAVIWRREHPALRIVGPFTRDRKALLVSAAQPKLARDLDRWLLSAQAEGRLDRIREVNLGEAPGQSSVTDPLPALLAAVDERLALMGWVAEAKRLRGAAVEAPAVERRVLEAAVRNVREAEGRNSSAPTRQARDIRNFFRAQIEAAKAIQHRTLARAASPPNSPPPDLDTALRPALLRIGDRLATLLVALPMGLDEAQIRRTAQRELTSSEIRDEDRRAITLALVRLVENSAATPRSKPSPPGSAERVPSQATP